MGTFLFLEWGYFVAERRKTPRGITLKPWINGEPNAWDFTCFHRLARSNHRVVALPRARAATEAEARKRSHNVDIPDTFQFPLGAEENFGDIGDDS